MHSDEIFYKKSAAKELLDFDKKLQAKIKEQIEKELRKKGPVGKKLQGEFAGLYRIDVAKYRVVYALRTEGKLILRIRHRKEVYR